VSRSFDFPAPDLFTAGAVGPPGRRVFYLQARQGRTVATLKIEKEQVNALAEYLAALLARLPGGGAAVEASPPLVEPATPAWVVRSLGVGYDEARDRVLIVAEELVEEEDDEEEEEEAAEARRAAPSRRPASARFALRRAQAAAFVERARELVRAGRPACGLCGLPIDPEGHVCPRLNGHGRG
jgi:uncharacterized repeat protein (TIGR03847 family)